MRDGPVRTGVKAVARWVKAFDLAVTRWVLARRGEPRYRLTGTCNGCGRCCEAPAIPVGRLTWYLPTARRLFLWWQRVVNGFHLVSVDRRFRIFTFRCSHYEPATRRCDSYASRPLMCRDYPVPILFLSTPTFFPECSHGAVDRNAEAFRAALVAAGVTGEKLAEVERKLALREPPPDAPQ